MFSNKLIRDFSRKLGSSTSLLFYSTKYPKEVNVVKSKLPEINIPNSLLNDYVWLNVDKWKDKTALVRSCLPMAFIGDYI